jgi:ubiquinone/menaquinone biosynthesis C-methylase UbiE
MSTGTPEDAKRRAATTYNAASDHYDDAPNAYWERYGRRTVERLDLKPGAHVLDVCCGSGASAIPAAEAVGPEGSVLGIDLAENLLTLARAKAKQNGLANIEFRTGDMLNLGLPDEHFDAVICVFGIFFVPDVVAAARELWRLVAPGGILAVTTWGPGWSEPMSSAFWNAVREFRPDLYRGFNPWDLITDPDQLRMVLTDGGVENPTIEPEPGTQPLHSPDDWWTIALGSGLRGTIDQLDPANQDYVRQQNLEYARNADIREVETNVVYAVAHRHSERTRGI